MKRIGMALVWPLLLLPASVLAQNSVHVTWLWHLEQPIYWPAPNGGGLRYQTVWDSILAKRAGATHPLNDLDTIFGLDDRVAVYQYRVRDAVNDMRGQAEAGAQISYSGGLIENVQSLGAANQLGYTSSWKNALNEARSWTTSGGKPRLDIVQFSFHHGLLPLLDAAVVRKDLELYRAAYAETWGSTPMSRGLFPSEMAFSEHLIPTLVATGIEWVVVSNSHLSRACDGFPYLTTSENIPPPNLADVLNPAQPYYNGMRIDRGVEPRNAVPFAYVPHRARYVDPATGQESKIVVVPAAQAESWRDGYSCQGVAMLDALAPYNNTARPILLLLAHDGDNAWGGGFSYYRECIPTLVGSAASAGYSPTTIEQYLADHPVPTDDVVHVESGAWVNADGDFGAPTFLNWNRPLVDQTGSFDLATGWAEDERNWAIMVAATNEVLTADAAVGPARIDRILHPDNSGTLLEQAWHFLLGSLNSGYMYYGKVLDMELKPTVACNEAVARARTARGSSDDVGPTIWLPQRYPDNPGGLNFGPLYRYRQVIGERDFWVWTFAHDVSSIAAISLKVRVDQDGINAATDDVNETYAGGAGVGGWQTIPLTTRDFPGGNVFNDPEIDTSILPTAIADLYYAQVTGYSNALLDYYIEASDMLGHLSCTPIQHLFVADETPPSPTGVHWTPQAPYRTQTITIYSPNPGHLRWGVDSWQAPDPIYWPSNTLAWGDAGQAVETSLAGRHQGGRRCERAGRGLWLSRWRAAKLVDCMARVAARAAIRRRLTATS